MGIWGREPWDSDQAADWFGGLWDGSSIPEQVVQALRSPNGLDTYPAIWFCTEMCRVYVWPIDRYQETLTSAISACERLIAREDEDQMLDLWDDPEVEAKVESFLAQLTARRDRSDAT
jgi:hypothetical protein